MEPHLASFALIHDACDIAIAHLMACCSCHDVLQPAIVRTLHKAGESIFHFLLHDAPSHAPFAFQDFEHEMPSNFGDSFLYDKNHYGIALDLLHAHVRDFAVESRRIFLQEFFFDTSRAYIRAFYTFYTRHIHMCAVCLLYSKW